MCMFELEQLEENIKDLRWQLAAKRTLLVTIAPDDEVRIEQQIEKLVKKIGAFEHQKQELIAEMTTNLAITNDDAELIVAEIVAKGELISTNHPDDISPDILDLLQQILVKLNESDKPAAAKLKGAISALPPFFSLIYEAELDTESTVKKYFPTFSRWTKDVRDRLKK